MASTSKYLQFPIKEADHRKLKLLSIYRNCVFGKMKSVQKGLKKLAVGEG